MSINFLSFHIKHSQSLLQLIPNFLHLLLKTLKILLILRHNLTINLLSYTLHLLAQNQQHLLNLPIRKIILTLPTNLDNLFNCCHPQLQSLHTDILLYLLSCQFCWIFGLFFVELLGICVVVGLFFVFLFGFYAAHSLAARLNMFVIVK